MDGLPGRHTDEVNCAACGPLSGRPVVAIEADGKIADHTHVVLRHRDEQGNELVREDGGPRVITELPRAVYESQGGV